MNKVFLIGNLTRDPELTETPSGVAVCHFAIAVNRNYSSQDGERQTDFFNCTAWRAMAETIARYTKKGKKGTQEEVENVPLIQGLQEEGVEEGLKKEEVSCVSLCFFGKCLIAFDQRILNDVRFLVIFILISSI